MRAAQSQDIRMSDVEHLFMNLDQLIVISAEMLTDFEERMEEWPMNTRICLFLFFVFLFFVFCFFYFFIFLFLFLICFPFLSFSFSLSTADIYLKHIEKLRAYSTYIAFGFPVLKIILSFFFSFFFSTKKQWPRQSSRKARKACFKPKILEIFDRLSTRIWLKA